MKTRKIKRYSNRKLYDTVDKQYVTLEDIIVFVKRGDTVQVTERASGNDITNQILTQVILEQGKQGSDVIPSEILHDVIRWGGNVFEKSFRQFSTGIESLVHESFEKIVPGRIKKVQELENKIEELESVITEITNQKDNQTTTS